MKENRRKTAQNSFPLLVVTTDNFTGLWKKNEEKTVETSFPFLVVTTDNFTAMKKRKEENSWKFFSTPSSDNRQLHRNAEEKEEKQFKILINVVDPEWFSSDPDPNF